MRAWRALDFLLLFTLASIGFLDVTDARPAEGDDFLDYPIYDISEAAKQSDSESEGSIRPCTCANQQCGCCSGTLLPLPVWLRPRMCMNMTYIEEEFALKMALSLNDVVMYRRKVSGRNPPPACVSPPRIPRAQLCVKLNDVYLIQRNIHACMSVEGLFNKQVYFSRMLGCMRMGANGVAVVNPEDGGGLPGAPPLDPDDEEPNDEDDYDQVDEDYDPVDEEDNTISEEENDGAVNDGGTSEELHAEVVPNGKEVVAVKNNPKTPAKVEEVRVNDNIKGTVETEKMGEDVKPGEPAKVEETNRESEEENMEMPLNQTRKAAVGEETNKVGTDDSSKVLMVMVEEPAVVMEEGEDMETAIFEREMNEDLPPKKQEASDANSANIEATPGATEESDTAVDTTETDGGGSTANGDKEEGINEKAIAPKGAPEAAEVSKGADVDSDGEIVGVGTVSEV